MYLADTNTISEMRKATTGRAAPRVQAWFRAQQLSDIYISVVTILEIRQGILSLRRREPAQADALNDWLYSVLLDDFAHALLPVNVAVAMRCAELHLPTRRDDRDMLIAATALVHNLTVVTRHFEPTGVRLINPWN